MGGRVMGGGGWKKRKLRKKREEDKKIRRWNLEDHVFETPAFRLKN